MKTLSRLLGARRGDACGRSNVRSTDDRNDCGPRTRSAGYGGAGRNDHGQPTWQRACIRSDVSDSEGLYHLNAMPVGSYDVVAELSGFTRLERKDIAVDVSETTNLNLTLRLAPVAETVTVVGDTPLIPTTSSSVGQVVDLTRIERLPLDGRQFANLAATVPGVGLGFHSDPTKATEYSPQISGGNGRNLNYVVDGGDNNDDTIGGLAQLYPLEGIQQFNLHTQRFDAQYGRGTAVLNVVTKSGTNDVHGSAITFFRDTALNARTMTEDLNRTACLGSGAAASCPDKQEYRRYQYGGSLGGPIAHDRVFYFAAFERTQQDTKQTVNTLGLFPAEDGVFPVPGAREPVHGQADREPPQRPLLRGPLRLRRQLVAERRGTSRRAFDLGDEHERVPLGQCERQLGVRRHEAERVRLPGRDLRQRDSRQHDAAGADVPERR